MEPSSSPPHLSLSQQAINASLNCLWEKASALNRRILKLEPKNIDALSRLARACFELRKLEQAKKYYSQALKIDPYNPIALKNLKILKVYKNGNGLARTNHQNPITPNMFLHEPGKTKVVTLLKVAEPQKLSSLYPGMAVCFITRNRSISIADSNNQYLGALPDDISFYLVKLLRGGNKYSAIIKSVKVNGLSILIRESFRAARFKNQSSFPEMVVKFQSNPTYSSPEPTEAAEEE